MAIPDGSSSLEPVIRPGPSFFQNRINLLGVLLAGFMLIEVGGYSIVLKVHQFMLFNFYGFVKIFFQLPLQKTPVRI